MYGNPYLPQLQDMQSQLMQLQNNLPNQRPMQMQQSVQIQFVKGIEGAKAYNIPASSSVILMDSNDPVFYMKTTDANGIETVKAYDFTERETASPEAALDKYVLKSDFEKLTEQVDELMKSITAPNAEKSTRGGKTA